MHERTRLLVLLAPSLLLAAALGGGCPRGGASGYVWVQQDKYQPGLPVMEGYRGRELFLSSFTNQAENTSTFYYYSPDRAVTYEAAPTLHSYLWHCFRKALESQGMKVHEALPESPQGASIPELQLLFHSWTDEEFRFKIMMLKGGQLFFEKDYNIVWEPGSDRDPAFLEQQAYRMLDATVAALLIDPAFRAALAGPG